MALYHQHIKIISRGKGHSGVAAMAYRSGTKLMDKNTGQTHDYTNKENVDVCHMLIPENAPNWIKDIQLELKTDRQSALQKFSDIVEAHEKRLDEHVYRESEFALPEEFTREQNVELADGFIQKFCADRGMVVVNNFHFDVDEKTGQKKPHCHALMTTRELTEDGFGKKMRQFNSREFVEELRENLAEHMNEKLKEYGFDERVDHRSYADRGMDVEPQPKRGRNVIEMTKRGIETDKQAKYEAVQRRNLFRIMKRPELVFEIVGKTQSTFTHGDILKVLHRYVDDSDVFKKLESRLLGSKDLVLLEADKANDVNRVYTTRGTLQIEANMVERADILSGELSHEVDESQVSLAIERFDEKLESYGGLSTDQKHAIRHMLKADQLSCVVGYAGAGKTTAIEVAKEVWEARGYKVVGLAPTGRAAENLRGMGVESMTGDRYLRSYKGDRGQ